MLVPLQVVEQVSEQPPEHEPEQSEQEFLLLEPTHVSLQAPEQLVEQSGTTAAAVRTRTYTRFGTCACAGIGAIGTNPCKEVISARNQIASQKYCTKNRQCALCRFFEKFSP